MPAKTFSCPHCGLVLTIEPTKTGTRLAYDPREWKRVCKHPDLDSPVLCLLQRRRKDARSASPAVRDGRPVSAGVGQ